MPTLEIHLPQLFQKQIEIIEHPARYKVLACGRRFGKTLVAADVLINAALDGYPVGYFSLTGKNASEIWEIVKGVVDPITQKKNETERRIELVTGGKIEFWSLDKPTPSRGRKYAGIVLDEAAFIRNVRTVWGRVLRPFLADYEGWAYFMSSPNGASDWFHQMYLRGQDPAYPKWASWNLPTWANPHISAAEIEEIKSTTAVEDFNQEYGAQFTAAAGLIYPEFSTANITDKAEYNPSLPIIMGIDDGYAHGQGRGSESYHPRVVLLGQVTPEGGLNIFKEYVRTGVTDYYATIDEILAWGYPVPDAAYIDSSAAMFKGALWNRNIFTVPQTHKVSEGIRNVRRMVCDANGKRLLKIHPRCTETIYEFSAYRANENASAQGGELKPVKCDDHCVDSIRYMSWYLRYES